MVFGCWTTSFSCTSKVGCWSEVVVRIDDTVELMPALCLLFSLHSGRGEGGREREREREGKVVGREEREMWGQGREKGGGSTSPPMPPPPQPHSIDPPLMKEEYLLVK